MLRCFHFPWLLSPVPDYPPVCLVHVISVSLVFSRRVPSSPVFNQLSVPVYLSPHLPGSLCKFVCLCISHLSPLVPCVPFSVPSAFFYFFFCISLVPQCAPACFCVFVFFALTFFLCVFLAFCFFGLLCSDSSFVIGAPLLLLSTSHVQSCVLVNETRVIISLHRNELK